MIKQLSIFLLGVGFASHSLAQPNYSCHLGQTFATTTAFNAGPNVYAAVQNNAAVATSIGIGRDAWDVTNAVDLIGGWTGTVSASDCAYLLPFQLGAFNFETNTSCITNIFAPNLTSAALAFVDWPTAGCGLPTCGTYSLTVNTKWVFVANGSPNTNEFDLRSVLAHEFGHVLGLGHMQGGTCTSPTADYCSNNPNVDTMQPGLHSGPGETCLSTITGTHITPNQVGDSDAMNYYYP